MKTFIIGRIPTTPDVNMLCGKFDNLNEGDVVKYGEIESVIGAKRGSGRFQSVTTAWRKKLDRDSNIVLLAVPGVGFKVADPSDRVDLSSRKVKSGTRSIVKGATIASSTDRSRLTEEQRRVCDHISMAATSIQLAVRIAPKPVELPASMA